MTNVQEQKGRVLAKSWYHITAILKQKKKKKNTKKKKKKKKK
jgi:hypothetical protein